jgi:hypothetical protein
MPAVDGDAYRPAHALELVVELAAGIQAGSHYPDHLVESTLGAGMAVCVALCMGTDRYAGRSAAAHLVINAILHVASQYLAHFHFFPYLHMSA